MNYDNVVIDCLNMTTQEVAVAFLGTTDSKIRDIIKKNFPEAIEVAVELSGSFKGQTVY